MTNIIPNIMIVLASIAFITLFMSGLAGDKLMDEINNVS